MKYSVAFLPVPWRFFCLLLLVVGLAAYAIQFYDGFTVTGLSRSFMWGFYIGQFTFVVGIAAGAVMVSLPFFWHGRMQLQRILPLAEWFAAVCVLISALFLFVDLGRPQKALYVLLHPSPTSLIFWDFLLLAGYGVLNVFLAVRGRRLTKNSLPYPPWFRVLASLGIVMAFSIHTVTGFLYSGLPGKSYWLSALTAPNFLVSALCSGPAALLLVLLAAQRRGLFQLSAKVVKSLCTTITYALFIYIFLHGCELFSSLYSGLPIRVASLKMLYLGGEGGLNWLTLCTWLSVVLLGVSCLLLPAAATRRNTSLLAFSLGCVLSAIWLDKCIDFLSAGLTVDAFGRVTHYAPALVEFCVGAGIYACGAFLLCAAWSVCCKGEQRIGSSTPPEGLPACRFG